MAISRRYVMASQTVARRLPGVLRARGLDAGVLKDWYLTIERGEVWLFAEMNPRKVERLERYTAQALVHQISTVCDGTPVVISNTSGLRYCFLLSKRPRLPRSVDFPGCERGLVRLGVGQFGLPVTVQWKDLGHVLVAGMTDSGKSNFLRLAVHQAVAEGAALLLSDVDRRTFPMLAGHPALLSDIACTPDDAHSIVVRGLAECDRRSVLYDTVPNFPDTLNEFNAEIVKGGGDPLPRIVIILDEFNATMTQLGGNRGQFAADVTTLGWRGRKFGINLIFAAQEFSKGVVGRVRDQIKTVVCFKVKAAEVARNVGCAGADKIPEKQKGRAVSDRWGLLQTYFLDKRLLTQGSASDILTSSERALITWALENNGGYLSLVDVQEHARLGQYTARKLAIDWERRGWLRKDSDAGNKRYVTAELRDLIHNLQPPQTPTTPFQQPQTDPQTIAPDRQTDPQTVNPLRRDEESASKDKLSN